MRKFYRILCKKNYLQFQVESANAPNEINWANIKTIQDKKSQYNCKTFATMLGLILTCFIFVTAMSYLKVRVIDAQDENKDSTLSRLTWLSILNAIIKTFFNSISKHVIMRLNQTKAYEAY